MGHRQRGDEAIVGQSWHTYRWEAGGMAVLGSIQPQPVETQRDGTLLLTDIAAAIKPDDPHFARTRLGCWRTPPAARYCPPPTLPKWHSWHAGGLALHLDGARLFNAATANAEAHGTDVYDEARAICQHFDTASLCLSKGLGLRWARCCWAAPTSSAAKRTRKILGGAMRQCGMLAAAGHHALQHHVRRLADDHALLRQLAAGMAETGRSHPVLQGR